jgi:hypothetical protein
MKGSPTDEKGKDNGSYKQKEKLALFDSLLDCTGIRTLICQVWNGLAAQVSRNLSNIFLIISCHIIIINGVEQPLSMKAQQMKKASTRAAIRKLTLYYSLLI